jgi:hypothetical protein
VPDYKPFLPICRVATATSRWSVENPEAVMVLLELLVELLPGLFGG